MKAASKCASCASRPIDMLRFRTIDPRSGSSRPAASRSIVVLPAPFGPTSPIRSPERDGAFDRVEDHERPDLAGDAGEPKDGHQLLPATEARAAARRVAAARFVRSVRARATAAAASSGVRPTVPSPASSVQRGPRRTSPPLSVRRMARADLRSAADRRWHHEQKCVDRAPTTTRRTGRPQRRQASPVRWYTSSRSCIDPSPSGAV